MNDTPASLADALAAHGVEVPDNSVETLERYCQVLWSWNEKINLTRHDDFDKFVSRDLVDTLQLSALIKQGEEILDVGSGGGVPGVLLAILRPDLDISLTESVGKKARALQSIVDDLGLPINVHACRAESVLEDFRYDSLTIRAAGPLWKICHWFEPHWASIGKVLAIKGPRWVQERGEARHRGLMHSIQLRCVSNYTTPGSEAKNVILKLWFSNPKVPREEP